MAEKTYDEVKQVIKDNVYENDEGAITGKGLQDTLFDMLDYSKEGTSPFKNGTGENSAQQRNTGANASGAYAVATGNQTTASGKWSYAEGFKSAASAEAAHSEGINTSASEIWSHAEGDRTKSSGKSSHAEGSQTTAAGESSHTEGAGTSTTATAKGAHAEGINTTASEKRAHAEGFGTTASGDSAHAEGYQTTAFGANSHSEGRSTYAGGGRSHVEGCGTVTGTGKEPTITEDTAKGIFAHAEGNGTLAEAASSHAEGKGTRATNEGEHAEGLYNISNTGSTTADKTQHSVGIGTSENERANAFEIMKNGDAYLYGIGGYSGTTITSATTLQEVIQDCPFESGTSTNSAQQKGTGATASGPCSVAEGGDNIEGAPSPETGDELLHAKAEGYASHAEGAAYAKGNYSHAEGGGNQIVYGKKTVPTAEGKYSHAEGSHTHAAGEQSHAEGNQTHAGNNAHAEGYGSDASADSSHAEGYATVAIGAYSHAEGCSTSASNQDSHAEGSYTTASGVHSHAEGAKTAANGSTSHAEGVDCRADGNFSHVEGANSKAIGATSHAEGSSTTATGDRSHTEGAGTQALNYAEHAEGKYNKSNKNSNTFGDAGNTSHSVGIGSSANSRKNAFEIMQNGDAYLYGVGGYSGTTISDVTKLQTVINNKQDSLVSGTNIKKVMGEDLLDDASNDLNITDLQTLQFNTPIAIMENVSGNTSYGAVYGEVTGGHTWTPVIGMTPQEFAQRIGVGISTFLQFLQGKTAHTRIKYPSTQDISWQNISTITSFTYQGDSVYIIFEPFGLVCDTAQNNTITLQTAEDIRALHFPIAD